jgi:hypothetical protein
MAAMVELPSHVLANIFERLSLQERLCVLPCVCSAWKRVCSDDLGCWAGKVDVRGFAFSLHRNSNPDRLAQLLVKDKNRGFVSFFRVAFLSSADMLLDSSTRCESLDPFPSSSSSSSSSSSFFFRLLLSVSDVFAVHGLARSLLLQWREMVRLWTMERWEMNHVRVDDDDADANAGHESLILMSQLCC